jgi:hypothetical protein
MTSRVKAAGPTAGPELWKLISCEQGNDSDPLDPQLRLLNTLLPFSVNQAI